MSAGISSNTFALNFLLQITGDAAFNNSLAQVSARLGQISSGVSATTAPINTFSAGLSSVGGKGAAFSATLNNVGASARAVGAPIQGAAGSMGTLGTASDTTKSKLTGFGEMFRGNKGLIFGVAGLSSAIAEAVGMLGMYGDAAAGQKEAQEAVNKLVADGKTNTLEYKHAMDDLASANKWLAMATRNTMLSMMDQVFFGTMVISQISQMTSGSGRLAGALGKLKGAFTGAFSSAGSAAAITAATSAVSGLNVNVDKTTKSSGAAKMGMMGLVGTLGAVAGGAAGAALVILQTQESMQNLADLGIKFSTGSIFNMDFMQQSMKEYNFVVEKTGMSIAQLMFPTPEQQQKLQDLSAEFKRLQEAQLGNLKASRERYDSDVKNIQNWTAMGKSAEFIIGKLKDWGYTQEEINIITKDAGVILVDVKTKEEEFMEAKKMSSSIINQYAETVANHQQTMEQVIATIKETVAAELESGDITKDQAELILGTAIPALKLFYDGTATLGTGLNALTLKQKAVNLEFTVMSDKQKQWQGATDESIATVNENAAAAQEFEQMQIRLSKAFGTNVELTNANIEVYNRLDEIVTSANDKFKEQEFAIIETAAAYGPLNAVLLQAVENETNNVGAMAELVSQMIPYNRALTDTKYAADLVGQGHLAAAVGVDEFLSSLVKGIAEEQRTHALLTQVAKDLGIALPAGINLTNDELFELIENFKKTGDTVDFAAKAFHEALIPALETFSGVINAEDGKAFNEEWTKIAETFDTVGKKSEKTLAGILGGFNLVSKGAKELSIDFNAAFVAMATNQSPKIIKDFIGEMVHDFQDIVKYSPQAKTFQPIIDLAKHFADTGNLAGMTKLAPIIQKINEVLAGGIPDASERKEIQRMMNEAFGTSGNVIPPVNTALGDNKEKADSSTTSLDKLTPAINTASRAFSNLSIQVNLVKLTIPAPNIATFTTAINTVSKTFSNFTIQVNLAKLTPNIDLAPLNSLGRALLVVADDLGEVTSANNTLAKTINQISSNFKSLTTTLNTTARALVVVKKDIDAIKSKAVTITTTYVTRYRTVYMAKGFHGVVSGPMNFTAGEAGPERVDVTPLGGGGNNGVTNSVISSGGGGRGGSSGGGGPTTINVMLPDGSVLARAVIPYMNRHISAQK